MRGWGLISLIAGLGGVAGCAHSPGPPPVPLAAPDAPEVLLVVMEDERRFTAFVEPNSISRGRALALARAKAGGYCRDALGSAKTRIKRIKRRSWAVPDAWQIDGTCA